MFSYKKSVLDNGLRVITVPLPNSTSTTVGILVGAGSRYEEPRINGLSHILEHMFFKGTTKRPTAAEIARESEGMGAIHNAWTDVEAVAYWMKVPPPNFEHGLEILSDMIADPLLKAEELAKERHVVIEEFNRDEDDHPRKVAEIFQQLLWPNQALGRPIIGNKKTILSASRDDLINFRRQLYVAGNMVVAVAGPVEHDQVVEQVEKNLSGLTTSMPQLTWERAQDNQTGLKGSILEKKSEQAHLMLGLKTFSFDDHRRPVLSVLNSILGIGMSSRLFLSVREKKHLAYTISSSADYFHDTGAWGVYAGVTLDRLAEAVGAIMEEVKLISKELVGNKELAEAKEKFKGHFLFGLETTHRIMEYFGREELLEGKISLPEDRLAQIEQVTANQVRQLAKEMFVRKQLNLVVLGPYPRSMAKKLDTIIEID